MLAVKNEDHPRKMIRFITWQTRLLVSWVPYQSEHPKHVHMDILPIDKDLHSFNVYTIIPETSSLFISKSYLLFYSYFNYIHACNKKNILWKRGRLQILYLLRAWRSFKYEGKLCNQNFIILKYKLPVIQSWFLYKLTYLHIFLYWLSLTGSQKALPENKAVLLLNTSIIFQDWLFSFILIILLNIKNSTECKKKIKK